MALPIVRNLHIYALDPVSIVVEWEIEPTTLDLSTYIVEVWRSEAQGGPYVRVSLPMPASDVFTFRDSSVNLHSKWRQHFYRIRVINGADSTEYREYGETPYRQVLEGKDPSGVGLEAPPDLLAMEAVRRFELVLREYAGRRVLVLVSRSWGQNCPECWDSLKRRRTKSNCMTCFDTGYAGGFFRPMETFSMKPPHDVMVQLTSLFEMQADDRVMWFSRYPKLKPTDVVVNTEGERFRVIRISRSEKASSLTRQTVQIRQLSRDQAEYKYPVRAEDWQRNSFTAGALREHIRAQDITSYHEAVQQKGLGGVEVFPANGEIATNVEDSDAPE